MSAVMNSVSSEPAESAQLLVRLADRPDFSAIVELARAHCQSTDGGSAFSEEKTLESCEDYLSQAHPTLFVIEENRSIIGMLVATICSPWHRRGIFTTVEMLFVVPERRDTSAGMRLVEHFVDWSRRLGAFEMYGLARYGLPIRDLLDAHGFEPTGSIMHRNIDHG